MSNLIALIMAGGKGRRFWPASTDSKPKQFLNLISKNSMLQETVNRLLPIIDIEHIFISTSMKYKDICLNQIPNLPQKNIIIEPVSKNTAPCILLSSIYINQIFENSTILVLPSDHLINNNEEFLSVIRAANSFLKYQRDAIITIGMKPNRPETGYGYINFGNNICSINNFDVKKVKKFVEKPNKDLALKYIENGDYLWNTGMFMFDIEFIINQYKLYAKDTYNLLVSLPPITHCDYYEKLVKKYSSCINISVDYAIMEKTNNLFVIPSDFGWDDIGTWMSLERYLDKDIFGNVSRGNTLFLNSKNNIVFSPTKDVIILDAENLFIIESDKKLVVGAKKSLSKVYEIKDFE